MTIAWTGTGGLFTRIGRIGGILYDINTYQLTTIPGAVNNLTGNYSGADLALIDNVQTQQNANQQSAGGFMSYLQQVATNTVNTMVYNDNPQSSNTSLAVSMAEVIRQMNATSQTVQSSTATATVSAGGSNAGNGSLVVSCQDANGTTNELQFAETIKVACSSDASTGATAGNEGFTALGEVAVTNAFDWRYPVGSGATSALSCVNPGVDNQQGNLLTNGDFENWTSNTPNNWTIATGVAGTDVLKSTGQHYTGSASLELVGGATNTALTQTFNLAAGTLGNPVYQTAYAFNVWMKVDVVPAAGVITFDLVDGSGTTVNNYNGSANSVAVNIHTGVTTSWQAFSGVFQTPHVMPSTLKFRLRLSTAMSAGSNLFIDRLGFGATTRLYPGGPSLALFSGSANFYLPDYFLVTTTNSRGGATSLRTFQSLFQRLFNLTGMGLMLPSSNSPSISDGLIA